MKQILLFTFLALSCKLSFSQSYVKKSKVQNSKAANTLLSFNKQTTTLAIVDSGKLIKTCEMVKVAEVNNYPNPN